MQTYKTATGTQVLTIEELGELKGCKIRIEDQSNQAEITLNAGELRKLSAAVGLFVELFPGAWSRLSEG